MLVDSSGIENGRNFVGVKAENLCNRGPVLDMSVALAFCGYLTPSKSEMHFEPLGSGCGGMDNSVGPTVEMEKTSKGKFFDSGLSSVMCDFNRNGFDLSEDEFDFDVVAHGLSEEILLNQVGQRLQGYFQNECENFMGKFPHAVGLKQKTKMKKGKAICKGSAG